MFYIIKISTSLAKMQVELIWILFQNLVRVWVLCAESMKSGFMHSVSVSTKKWCTWIRNVSIGLKNSKWFLKYNQRNINYYSTPLHFHLAESFRLSVFGWRAITHGNGIFLLSPSGVNRTYIFEHFFWVLLKSHGRGDLPFFPIHWRPPSLIVVTV